jgi:hypothetical protein
MADYLYLCRSFNETIGFQIDEKMLIAAAIVLILALLFGKITIKEIKKYVRKRKNGRGTEC